MTSDQSRKTANPSGTRSATQTATEPVAKTPVGSAKAARTAKGTTTPASSSRASVQDGQPQARRAERRAEMIKQRKVERRKVYEQRQRQWLYTRIGFGVLGLLLIGGLLYGAFTYFNDDEVSRPEGAVEYSYTASDHTASLEERVDYAESPPVGGRHAPSPFWQNCGYYDAPIQNESAVHSLEHGAVWITHPANALSDDQLERLREWADEGYVVVSPYDQPEPIVLSAWNNQLRLNQWDEAAIDQFIRYFRSGPQTPERGAACTGGVGDPL